jgi:hypothetical protein
MAPNSEIDSLFFCLKNTCCYSTNLNSFDLLSSCTELNVSFQVSWWSVHFISGTLSTLLGEYLCMRLESETIELTDNRRRVARDIESSGGQEDPEEKEPLGDIPTA